MATIIKFPKDKRSPTPFIGEVSAKIVSLDFTKTVNAFREYVETLEQSTGYAIKTDEFNALLLTKPTLYQLQEYINNLHVKIQIWLNMIANSANDKPIC